MTKRKKVVILSCMIALLAITAVFNFVLTGTEGGASNTAATVSADYFTQYRTERVNSRNEELLQLEGVIASQGVTETALNEALSLKLELTSMTEREMLLESLLKAYGFDDVVVVIGLDSENVNVITKSADFTTDDAILIYTVVSEEINAQPENVKIIPIS